MSRAAPANSVETFRDPRGWALEYIAKKEPSCFNSEVNFRRFRITVEPIEEPFEVLAARLEKLWVESDNSHNRLPLKNAAAEIGYEFKGSFGEKRTRR